MPAATRVGCPAPRCGNPLQVTLRARRVVHDTPGAQMPNVIYGSWEVGCPAGHRHGFDDRKVSTGQWLFEMRATVVAACGLPPETSEYVERDPQWQEREVLMRAMSGDPGRCPVDGCDARVVVSTTQTHHVSADGNHVFCFQGSPPAPTYWAVSCEDGHFCDAGVVTSPQDLRIAFRRAQVIAGVR